MIRGSPSYRRAGFQIHALVFVLTMVLLALINMWTGAPYWVLWILPGWSIGLLAHWWWKIGPGAAKLRSGS